MALLTKTLHLGPPVPRIVFDVNQGGPTGPPHFLGNTFTTGGDVWADSELSSYAVAKGGGFDSANSLPGDWGKMDGFDVPFEALGIDDLTTVTRLAVHITCSVEIDYTDTPYPTEPPISDPPVGLLGMFIRSVNEPGYHGNFLEQFTSGNWFELHRVGVAGDSELHFLDDDIGDATPAGPVAQFLPLLADPSAWTMTFIAHGATASELATVYVYDAWLTVTYNGPDAPPELEDESGTSQFMRTY